MPHVARDGLEYMDAQAEAEGRPIDCWRTCRIQQIRREYAVPELAHLCELRVTEYIIYHDGFDIRPPHDTDCI